MCCIEIKATSEKLPTKITQIAAHIQEYKKVLYTNGLVWIYFDNSIKLTHETIEKVLPWKLLKAIKSSNCSEVEFTQMWNRLKEEAGLQWIIPLVFSEQDGMSVMLSTAHIDDTISREPVKINKEKYRDCIWSDIRADYGHMLNEGATATWETIDGEAAFENAGSLCHGWTAMPIYYYWTLK